MESTAIYKEALNTLQSLRLDLASINSDQQFSFRENVEPAYRELIELLLQPADGATDPTQEHDITLILGLELLDPQPLERQQMRLLLARLNRAIENFNPLTAIEQEKDDIVDKIPRAVVLLNQKPLLRH